MRRSNPELKLVDPRSFEEPLCAEVGFHFFYIDDDDDDTVPEHMKNSSYATAISICNMCKHKVECGEWGVRKERWGVWGGLTPPQRSAIRRTRNIVLGD